MIPCPNCRSETTSQTFAAHVVGRPIVVEACAPCNLFWFEASGSVLLTSEAVVDLFTYVGKASGGPRNPLAESFRCPRCSTTLALTHDVQRTTRFTYWRCTRDRGQLITFGEFLRQKNFIRAPSPAELAKLRETVRQVTCSQCGAPVDLAHDRACSHCGAPIALIDPEGVVKALQAMTLARSGTGSGSAAVTSAALSDAQVSAIFEAERLREDDRGYDLVAIGAAAIAALLGAALTSR